MADIVEGTYAIISVRSTKAIDVCGASDKSGTNVIQYNVTYGDAQIWAITKPENNHWQIINSLSGKSLDITGGTLANNTNIRQYDDNNSVNAQRFDIVDLNETFSYNGTAYEKYAIKAAGNNNFALDVVGASSSPGANVILYTYSGSSTNQQWIFVPVVALSESGAYTIGLAADVNMCVEIDSSSTANSASLVVNSMNDSNNQIFYTEIDQNSKCVRFIAAHSDKALDISGGTVGDAKQIIQYTKKASSNENQFWLPVQKSSVTKNSNKYPTYEIRAQLGQNYVMDCLGGGKTAKTKIGIYHRNDKINQRFFFVKNEFSANDIDMPGSISPSNFSREGHGSVTVTGLKFMSSESSFQARYKIRTYGTTTKEYTDSAWKNLANDSTARSGWGDAWTSTFDAAPVGGYVSVPFSKTISLTAESFSSDVIIEIRAYKSDYGFGFQAHGPVCTTTIHVVEIPTTSVSSMSVLASLDLFSINAKLSDSLGMGCSWLRGRLLGSNGKPISGWVMNTDEELTFGTDGVLNRLPNQGEVLTLQYTMLMANGAQLSNESTYTFSYGSGATLTPSLTYTSDGSCCGVVEANANDINLCFMSLTNDFENRLIQILPYETSNSKVKWRIVSPLNQDVNVTILSKSAASTSWDSATLVCRVEAHEFMWNWTDRTEFDSCAAVFVNTDAPPQQTRSYYTGVSFSKPAGRRYLVGFAPRMLEVTMSVEGVIVDDDACYIPFASVPNYTTIDDIRKLIPLSGEGIHPIYRTPYGDWYQVVIETVDISKTVMNLSKAVITQHVVED